MVGLCQSPGYRTLWGDRFTFPKTGERRLENDRTGFKLATSCGGVSTGERGDRILLDEPNSPTLKNVTCGCIKGVAIAQPRRIVHFDICEAEFLDHSCRLPGRSPGDPDCDRLPRSARGTVGSGSIANQSLEETMAKQQKPTVRSSKSRASAVPPAARSEATTPTGPTQDQMKKALDGAFAEQFNLLFSQLYNGLTAGLPKPDPKAAADRFATNIQSARAAYDIAIKLIE
jgi:hypothetical protein